jgi:outer membrane protein assembly factor BamB
VLVDLSGQVRAFSILTGAMRWKRGVGSDVRLAPAVGAGVVVIMDRGGTTTALDQATGRSLWTVDLEGTAAAFVDGTLVVLQDQTAHGLVPATGRSRWLRPFLGPFTRLAPLGDRLVIATKSDTVLLDGEGAVRARLGGFLELTVTPDRFVGWGTSQAQVFGADGTVIAKWPLPALTLARQDRPAVPTRDGVLLFGSDWTFEAWNDEL